MRIDPDHIAGARPPSSERSLDVGGHGVHRGGTALQQGDRLAQPGDVAVALVDALCGLFEHTTRAHRTLTTARLVLFMEASHNPARREAVSRGRATMESAVVPVLARLGAHDPQAAAAAVMACAEGLILHRIVRHDDADPRPTFDLVVRAALSPRSLPRRAHDGVPDNRGTAAVRSPDWRATRRQLCEPGGGRDERTCCALRDPR